VKEGTAVDIPPSSIPILPFHEFRSTNYISNKALEFGRV